MDPATLKPLESAQAQNRGGARAQRLVLHKEQVTAANVDRVSILVLLRLRTNTMRATYKRH